MKHILILRFSYHTAAIAAAAGFAFSFISVCLASDPLPFTQGNMDIGVQLVDDVLVGFWKNQGATVNNQLTSQDFAASQLVVTGIFDDNTPPPARPSGTQWDFLGVAAGEPVYILSGTGGPDTLPRLGFSTGHSSLSIFDGEITISLIEMTGPAGSTFALYTSSTNVPMTGTPLTTSGSVNMEIGEQATYNWSFSHMGEYGLTFRFLATDPSDDTFEGTTTFAFHIIPEPSSFFLLLIAGLGALIFPLTRSKS